MIIHRPSVMFEQFVARVNTHHVCFHATCESHRIAECTLIYGIGVAVPWVRDSNPIQFSRNPEKG
jgi:hypothetical protein